MGIDLFAYLFPQDTQRRQFGSPWDIDYDGEVEHTESLQCTRTGPDGVWRILYIPEP